MIGTYYSDSSGDHTWLGQHERRPNCQLQPDHPTILYVWGLSDSPWTDDIGGKEGLTMLKCKCPLLLFSLERSCQVRMYMVGRPLEALYVYVNCALTAWEKIHI